MAEDPRIVRPAPKPDLTPVDFEPGNVTGQTLGVTSISAPKAIAGRVTKIDLGTDDIAQVRVLKGPEYGHLTADPDNKTLSLVLTPGLEPKDVSFSIEVTHADGTTSRLDRTVDVVKGAQEKGWGLGDFYMLETGPDGGVVVEHGENHRKIYVSGSDDALTRADIAAMEGLPLKSINLRFLEDNPHYGGSPDMALAEEIAAPLWLHLTDGERGPNSNWLLLERGHEYDNLDRLIARGATGESELAPILITSYGDGAKPVVMSNLNSYQDHSENIVVQGVELARGAKVITSSANILFDDVTMTGGELNVQNGDGFTFYNSAIYDVYNDSTKGKNPDIWEAPINRVSGMFAKTTDGLLIQNSFFDHNGWAAGYDYDMSTRKAQPPSYFNHNVYLQDSNTDVTFIDNITSRGASYGAQVRSGGFLQDNLFLDNNIGVNFLGGDYKDRGQVGNYSLFSGNVVTSAGYKTVRDWEGAVSLGVVNEGALSSLVGNIVAHLHDPNNPSELKHKYFNQAAVDHKDNPIFFDDTIIYNWIAAKGLENDNLDRLNQNVDGLNQASLDAATIQLFAKGLMGANKATIADLANYLRAQYDGLQDTNLSADDIIAYFQKAFRIANDLPEQVSTLRFVPSELGEGVRWDNRLNWANEHEPGAIRADAVDLAGNWVQYSGTHTVKQMFLGDGGHLNIVQGRLNIDQGLYMGDDGGSVTLDRAGQLWLNGHSDLSPLTLDVAGGRLANTGVFRGTADITVSDNAQVLLGTQGGLFGLSSDSSLTIVGGDVRVGFDSDNSDPVLLTLQEDAGLTFVAKNGAFGTIREFFSGRYDSDSNTIRSGVHLGNGDLTIDASAAAAGTHTLLYVDEMTGSFGDINVTGLKRNLDAELVIDYDLDAIILTLTERGSGQIDIRDVQESGNRSQAEKTILDALNASQSIWNQPAVADPVPIYDEIL